MKTPLPTETLPGAYTVARVMSAGAAIIGVGLLLFGGFGFWKGKSNLRAARERAAFPVKLQAGETVHAFFKTSARLPLEIWLVLQRHQGVADEQIDECLLGTNSLPQISWKIRHDGVPTASGDVQSVPRSHFGTQETRGRLIGAFKPPSAGRYEFLANVASSQSGLESARPRIEIRASLAAMKNAGAQAAAGHIVGPIFGFVGLLLIVLAWRERRQIRRDLNGPRTSRTRTASSPLEHLNNQP